MSNDKKKEEEELEETQSFQQPLEDAPEVSGEQELDESTEPKAEENGSESADVKTPEEELCKLEAELSEEKDKYLRLIAEFDNYRKRVMKEKTELILNGGERVITSILPVLDDIERAEANMTDQTDIASIKEGISLIFEKLRTTLTKTGLKRIDPVGEKFDVDYHEAIAMVPGMPEDQKGNVIDCVQCGYQLNEKVIRHAKVAVAE